jgi:hypothetical protein
MRVRGDRKRRVPELEKLLVHVASEMKRQG